jgi:hypothetical protein
MQKLSLIILLITCLACSENKKQVSANELSDTLSIADGGKADITNQYEVDTAVIDTALHLALIPEFNKKIIVYARENGRRISSDYYKVNCSEFMTAFIKELGYKLSIKDIKKINIVSDLYFDPNQAKKGVVYYMVSSNTGKEITIDEALPGDIFQLWYKGSFGHCGIIHHIDTSKHELIAYSSFFHTQGFGIQRFPYNDSTTLYFGRFTTYPNN